LIGAISWSASQLAPLSAERRMKMPDTCALKRVTIFAAASTNGSASWEQLR
jgi:hypothetical protein